MNLTASLGPSIGGLPRNPDAGNAEHKTVDRLLRLGMWLQLHRRVPSVGELMAEFGMPEQSAYRARRECARVLGEPVPRRRS